MNLVSLFSGVGGLDEGLQKIGFAPVFCSEIDKHARSTLERFLEDEGLNPWINDDIDLINPPSCTTEWDAAVIKDLLRQ